MSVSNVPTATAVARGFAKSRPSKIFRFGQWVNIHYWTEEEKVILRRDYHYNMESLRELARHFGTTENAVRQELTRMGILMQTVRWAAEDQKYLEENCHQLSIKVIAKRLHKSRNAVAHKAHRLGVKFRARDGWFTKTEVAKILGVDTGWIDRRVNGRGLKFEMRPHDPDRTPQKGSYRAWHISEKSLRDFVRRYPGELTGHNVDFVMLVDILAGILYEGG